MPFDRQAMNQLLRQGSRLQDIEQLSNRSKWHIIVRNASILELIVLGRCGGPTPIAISLRRPARIIPLRACTGRLVVTAAEQNDIFGNHLGDIHLFSILVVIAAGLQPAFDVYLLPFR